MFNNKIPYDSEDDHGSIDENVDKISFLENNLNVCIEFIYLTIFWKILPINILLKLLFSSKIQLIKIFL